MSSESTESASKPDLPEAVTVYRRSPKGNLIQYEFGGRSFYMSTVDERTGQRNLFKMGTIGNLERAIKSIPDGTPVPASEVPPEPPLHALSDLDVFATPEDATASGSGREEE